MTKLFIDNEYVGLVKSSLHLSVHGCWMFCLADSKISYLTLRDDEIDGIQSINENTVNIATKIISIPDGYDAECVGSNL